MKKLFYILTLAGGLLGTSCADQLDTEPTTSISSDKLFENVTSAQAAIEGIYRYMYTSGFATNWEHENPGYYTTVMTGDLFGEDHVQKSSGQGWFWYDYQMAIHMDYANGSYGHPYFFWNFYYTLISNANYILAHEETLQGDQNEVKKLMAQAYAMRAFSYYYLIQIYQQTYVGHEDAPGVPIYTEPTLKGTPGKPRGTVKDVYVRINEDIDKAVRYFEENGKEPHRHASQIDYYVANGIKARICLTQHRYPEAAAAASEAMKAGYARIATVKEMEGMNSMNNPNVLWAGQVITDQGAGFAGLFSHLDADAVGMYAERAQHLISSQLHEMISPTDSRLNWWRGQLAKEGSGSNVSYCQVKFRYADYNNLIGDYIYMRYEEMLLIKAEAECMQDDFIGARRTLKQLMEIRDEEGYTAVLEARTDAKTYNQDTNAAPKTLLDEILMQRRVELWGEIGRLFDLQRLGLGFSRGGNHTVPLDCQPADVSFILPLPQTEIDGNENIGEEDNNPLP